VATAGSDVAVKTARPRVARREHPPGGGRRWAAVGFLAPAAIAIAAFIIYPTIDTIAQSFQTDDTREFVGLANYQTVFGSARIRTAIQNTVVWVVTAPVVITALGLIFAVVTERVSYATAIKTVLFLPMAISFLAVGVIWRNVYEPDPSVGLLNAAVARADEILTGVGRYPDATIPPDAPLRPDGRAIEAREPVAVGDVATLGLVGIPEPAGAEEAAAPNAPSDAIGVVVWRDFRPGGGQTGEVESGELGMPGVTVEVLDQSGAQVASGVTDAGGAVSFPGLQGGPFTVRLPASNFTQGFQGISWLGPALVTASTIAAFVWMQLGFAIVVIGSGLSALPRDLLEAARVDGAREWQVFRHITFPLLRPVVMVVFITLVINVLKIFDIVLVLPPPSVRDEANVIALEMWTSAFAARQFGVGAAVAVLLFILVIPIMVLNLRRFRREA
jgi:alpha-glucoside transport system permease protein